MKKSIYEEMNKQCSSLVKLLALLEVMDGLGLCNEKILKRARRLIGEIDENIGTLLDIHETKHRKSRGIRGMKWGVRR